MIKRIMITTLYGVSLLGGIGTIVDSGSAASGDLQKQSAKLIAQQFYVDKSG